MRALLLLGMTACAQSHSPLTSDSGTIDARPPIDASDLPTLTRFESFENAAPTLWFDEQHRFESDLIVSATERGIRFSVWDCSTGIGPHYEVDCDTVPDGSAFLGFGPVWPTTIRIELPQPSESVRLYMTPSRYGTARVRVHAFDRDALIGTTTHILAATTEGWTEVRVDASRPVRVFEIELQDRKYALDAVSW